MNNSKTLVVLLLLISLLLVGCGKKSNITNQTVMFDGYSIDVPSNFREINSGLVENKQILNKVLKSFKKDEERQFATNLVITKSEVTSGIDYDQFWTANMSKLRGFIVGYQPGEKKLISFECGDDIIQGVYTSFGIENSFLGEGGPYNFAQYQFVNNDKGYIISLATALPEEQEDLLNYLPSLICF